MAISLTSIRINSITLRSMLNEAKTICLNAIKACLPQEAVAEALADLKFDKEVYLAAVGKAAFSMAEEAVKHVKVKKGIVITKYGHVRGEIPGIDCYEAGHPVLDANSIQATEKLIAMCEDLTPDDTVLFLLSGGASSLFESPLIPLAELQELNSQMLKKGLPIFAINAIRKKLSKVKGGRFADICQPAKVYSIILSDVLADRLDTIGSGPTIKDETTAQEALKILDEYGIDISDETRKLIQNTTMAKADNSYHLIIGSVKILCEKAMEEAEKLGYRTILLSDHIDMEAK
ncbi:MAG: glycerate-2-kinase family protein, partial [Erysipelotrichaceae bacterium]|nr:glycerate-2-kinase family protein [Erysipelotrichaceae bacterium]